MIVDHASNQQTESFSLFLQKAQQLDLSPIAYQLMQSQTGPRWTKAQTVKAIAQYLAFLYLADYYPNLQLVPSLEIDRVWHYHILDTQKYLEDCQFLFGYIVHHFPYLGLRGEPDRLNQSKAYVLSKVLFSRHFGKSFAEQDSPSGDCEPIQLKITSSTLGYPNGAKSQLRPQIILDIQECLHPLFQIA